MERLTQKSINYCAEICRAQDCETYHGVRDDVCGDAAIYNRLAAYEDAEEQGRLIVLPCKVGDTVYVCSRGKICELTICDITEPEIRTKDGDGHRSIDFYPRDFGMYIHLSKEEAEKALKGVSEDA